jgi:hypothetical protein
MGNTNSSTPLQLAGSHLRSSMVLLPCRKLEGRVPDGGDLVLGDIPAGFVGDLIRVSKLIRRQHASGPHPSEHGPHSADWVVESASATTMGPDLGRISKLITRGS